MLTKKFMLVILVLMVIVACQSAPRQKTPLVVFGAGSLIIPFNALETAFEARYPEYDVRSEYHGSIQVMRHATELHEKIDVVATADQALIPMLMYATNDPESGQPYADWYIRFASNRLAIAYSPTSQYAGEINAQNWYEVLNRPGVKVGIADPRFDASGYRSLMVYKLAENYYGDNTIFASRFKDQFTMPISVLDLGNLSIIHVPEIVETKGATGVVIRGASIQLVALLESGDLDYAFEYESVIHQHGLQMVALPPELNLGETDYESNYAGVQVVLDFKRFSTVKPEFNGERIGYGITIPDNAPNPDGAAKFIAFLLSEEGHQIMQTNFHPLFDPAIGNRYENIPAELQSFCVPEDSP